jgi:hypothetical protein
VVRAYPADVGSPDLPCAKAGGVQRCLCDPSFVAKAPAQASGNPPLAEATTDSSGYFRLSFADPAPSKLRVLASSADADLEASAAISTGDRASLVLGPPAYAKVRVSAPVGAAPRFFMEDWVTGALLPPRSALGDELEFGPVRGERARAYAIAAGFAVVGVPLARQPDPMGGVPLMVLDRAAPIRGVVRAAPPPPACE